MKKPHACKNCEKSFKHISHLKKHNIVHSEEKKYECTECGDNFSQLMSLQLHLISHLKKLKEQL